MTPITIPAIAPALSSDGFGGPGSGDGLAVPVVDKVDDTVDDGLGLVIADVNAIPRIELHALATSVSVD